MRICWPRQTIAKSRFINDCWPGPVFRVVATARAAVTDYHTPKVHTNNDGTAESTEARRWAMRNPEPIGQPVTEQKRFEQELRALRLRASQHAAQFGMLAQLLRDEPGAIVFDEQSTRRRSDSVAHFESKGSGRRRGRFESMKIGYLIYGRNWNSFRRECGDGRGRSARSNTVSCQRP